MKTKQGLCCTCGHADSCGFLARHDHPIIFCEEFTVEPQRFHTNMEVEKPQETVVKMNLCPSCGRRQECDEVEKQFSDCENFVLSDY